MSRSSGESSGVGASARTKLGPSTPSAVVPQFQQTSNDGSTLAPHFGQVHMPRAPRAGDFLGLGSDRLGRRCTATRPSSSPARQTSLVLLAISEADRFQQLGRLQN